MNHADAMLDRAQGCLAGQLAGDALGSQVEFMTTAEIGSRHPGGVCEMVPSPVWHTLAGQATDDSEMALALARSLVAQGRFESKWVRAAYLNWLHSHPFDCGNTVERALLGAPNPLSEANGALMRVSPLGIFGARGYDLAEVSRWAAEDAALTHPNAVCVEANMLYVAAIADAVASGDEAPKVYRRVVTMAKQLRVQPRLEQALVRAASETPQDYLTQQGWVLIAFQNAFWQLLHSPSVESGIVNTIHRGGDTDTNAAIAGALLGAVHGIQGVPVRWVQTLRTCCPDSRVAGVMHPRPVQYWPNDFMELAAQLIHPADLLPS